MSNLASPSGRCRRRDRPVIVLVHRSTPDKVLPEIQHFGGTVLQSSLDNDAEARLQDALQAQGATATRRTEPSSISEGSRA
jgi:uncharacterized membrane protein